MLMMIAWGGVCVFLLWLYFQLAWLFKTVLECEGWRFWVALAIFAIPVSVLSYVAARLCKVFRRLPAREQVNLTEDSNLKEKVDKLKQYMKELPEDYDSVYERTEREDVKKQIENLRDESAHSDPKGWRDSFYSFERRQEDRALALVKSCCKHVALKTAACPWKAVDMAIVFVNSTLMIEKIARVYNRRVSRPAALRLLFRWFMNIYISGEIGAVTENAAQKASDKVESWLTNGDSADDSIAGMVSASLPIVSKIVGKVAEGAINAYFAYRMGRRAINEFKYVVRE